MTTPGTVLVVDDQPATLDALAEALGALGFSVLEARDGSTAITMAAEREPDVILLDVVMPGLDGFEVCRRLKAREETRLLPVVFLTGHGSREARLRGLAVGATDFLSKPFDLVELEVRVRNLVEFRRLTQDLDHAEQILFAIARTVELRHEGTGEHCDRLSRAAAAVGRRLGLDDESITALRRGGHLHDIGKVGIPDAVLLKPGRLDEGEWQVMRSHVDLGVQICSPLRSLRPVLPIIRHHHERLDGSGYPDGLSGGDVPMLARVFQAVDIFDALTSPRPYRLPVTAEEALGVLEGEVARGWRDGEVVAAFTTMIREGDRAVLGLDTAAMTV